MTTKRSLKLHIQRNLLTFHPEAQKYDKHHSLIKPSKISDTNFLILDSLRSQFPIDHHSPAASPCHTEAPANNLTQVSSEIEHQI